MIPPSSAILASQETQETSAQFSLHTDLPNSFMLHIRQAYKTDLNLSPLSYHSITHINSSPLYFPYCQSPCSFALDNKFPKANSSGNFFIFHSISSFLPATAVMCYKYFLPQLDDSTDHLPWCYSPPKNCSFHLASSLYSQVSGQTLPSISATSGSVASYYAFSKQLQSYHPVLSVVVDFPL